MAEGLLVLEKRVALEEVQIGHHLRVPHNEEVLPLALLLRAERGGQGVLTVDHLVDGVKHVAAVSSPREFVLERGHAVTKVTS